MNKGKTCDYCGKTHDDYGGTEMCFPKGKMIVMECNYCGGYNGLWAIFDNGDPAVRIG